MNRQKLSASSLKGIWAGITLSWDERYQLDEAAFRENLERLCKAGVHGIYINGSTGEFYALNFEEFRHLVDILVEVVSPTGIPIQVGCGSPNTRDTICMIEYVARKGCDGAQIILPFWMQLTDTEIVRFFKDVSTAFPSLPLIHYNTPRTKRFLSGSNYGRILEVAPNLIGVKFTLADTHFGELQEAVYLTPQLSYFVGENLLVSAMQIGVRGSYSSVVYMNPSFMLKTFHLAENGEWDKALAMQQMLVQCKREVKVLLNERGEHSIDPVTDKGLGVAAGFLIGHQRTRAPYMGWSDATLEKVRTWMRNHYPELVWSSP